MRSLEDKQPAEEARQYDRRWIVMIAVPIAAIILAVGIWALVSRPSANPSVGSDTMTESADTSDAPSGSGTVTTVKTTAKRGFAATTRGNNGGTGKITTAKVKTTTRAIAAQPSAPSSTTADTHKNNTVPSGESTSSEQTASSGESTSTEETTSSEETISSGEGTSDEETVSSATTAPSVTDVTYLYRDARRGDDFYANATLENAVVITGVSTPSQDGTYAIPDTLDGKTVVAIMGFAFSDDNVRDTVKQVVVPDSVKTIWNYAFAECGQMTDIYFCGDAIYTEAFAFADVADRVGTLTIHCAASCNDRNFRYYKTSASNYDALYEEWNG